MGEWVSGFDGKAPVDELADLLKALQSLCSPYTFLKAKVKGNIANDLWSKLVREDMPA
jgi:hypothetical protein